MKTPSVSNRLRVLIGDDHALIFSGIKTILDEHHEIVGAAANGRQLVDAALRLRPDLVIVDVSMPQLNGIEAARQIRAAKPGASIIFLSMHTNPLYVRKALEVGGRAYVLKSGASEELVDAIRTVLAGGIYLSPSLRAGGVANSLTNSSSRSQRSEDLTCRQLEILQLIAEGRISKEIAHILDISTRTVEFHRYRIMERLGANSVAEMIRMAIEQGLIACLTGEFHHRAERFADTNVSPLSAALSAG